MLGAFGNVDRNRPAARIVTNLVLAVVSFAAVTSCQDRSHLNLANVGLVVKIDDLDAKATASIIERAGLRASVLELQGEVDELKAKVERLKAGMPD